MDPNLMIWVHYALPGEADKKRLGTIASLRLSLIKD